MRIQLQKIMEAPLLIVQTIDRLTTSLFPIIDVIVLSGDVGESEPTRMDQDVRAPVDRALKVHGLPIECHHASWRDEGLS
jgi:hypothetical protein